MICYVDHHDAAYQWAQRRKLETHPTTGAAQFVEIRETVKEIVIPTYITKDHPKPPVLGHVKKDELLLYGVPLEWLDDVITATEDNIFELVDHLPQELPKPCSNWPRVEPDNHNSCHNCRTSL